MGLSSQPFTRLSTLVISTDRREYPIQHMGSTLTIPGILSLESSSCTSSSCTVSPWTSFITPRSATDWGRVHQSFLLMVCARQLLHCLCKSLVYIPVTASADKLGGINGMFALDRLKTDSLINQNSLNPLGNAWKYVNIPLQYGYAALLLLCFLLALGNRPAG